MIREYELYHGSVIIDLIRKARLPVSIKSFCDGGRLSSYSVNGTIGLQIKHSSKRLHPWLFTLKRQHLDELRSLRAASGSVYLVLVCHTDGIVCLTFDEVMGLISVGGSEQAWVRADRQRRQWYTITGTSGASLKRPCGIDALTRALVPMA